MEWWPLISEKKTGTGAAGEEQINAQSTEELAREFSHIYDYKEI